MPISENDAKVKSNDYECAGCKNVWQDENCVVRQNIENKEVYLCLNCDDWIVNKSAVLSSNWTLFDQYGNFRQDVWESCKSKRGEGKMYKGSWNN